MALDRERLSNWTFEDKVHRYEARDAILYALGVGCGDGVEDLPFVYEEGLRALPSMATVLGDPGFWLRDPRLGAGWARAVHGEQSIVLHAPLPAAGTVVARNTIDDVVDKGADTGVVVRSSRTLHDQASGAALATLSSTVILRGDGVSRETGRPTARPAIAMPNGPPDVTVSRRTLPQAALIYRLSGDLNPLHADPAVAAAAGFPKPILHGLCTMGVATRAILGACCDDDPARLKSIGVRFTAPVFPGEAIRTEIWRDGPQLRFRCLAAERETVVLNAGIATVEG